MKRGWYIAGMLVMLTGAAGLALAQQRMRQGSYGTPSDATYKSTDLGDRGGLAEWPVDQHFKKDVFTFARVRYKSFQWTDSWLTDFPDSDVNFSFRLQQMTSLKVNPKPVIVKLTDPELFDYPFIYMLEMGHSYLDDEEASILRRYLLNGGFLMVDDFWGVAAWNVFAEQMKKVFPEREPLRLDLKHPIFHCVFDLKELPQIPGIEHWANHKDDGVTWEQVDAREPEYYSFFDDKGRMAAMICHNTDLGDGWEREGEDPRYFNEFSEKKAYPLGINIVVYAMTH